MTKIPDDVYKKMYPNGDASNKSAAKKSIPFGFDDEIPTGGASFYANDPLNAAPATETPAQSAAPSRAALPSAGDTTQQPPQDEKTQQQEDADALPVILSAADFCADRADVQWLIKGHVQKDGLMMVYGESGAYKSFLVLDQALTIAAGLPDWNGAKVTPATVLYLTGEGKTGLQKRIAAWAQERGVALSDLRFYAGPFSVAMNKHEEEEKLINAVKAAGVRPDWIILDTLIHYLDGDENKAQDARDLIVGCAVLKNIFGCAVTLIHHVGVSEDAKHRARGSSAFRGAMDVEIEISAKPLDGGKKRVTMTQTKNKDSELAPEMTFTPRRVEIVGWADDDGEPITSLVLEPETEQQNERALKIPQKFQALITSYRKACESGLGKIGVTGDFKGLEHSKWRAFYCDSENGFTKMTTEKAASQEFNAGITALLEGGNIQIENPNTGIKETTRAKRLYTLTGKYEKEHFNEYAEAARNKPPQDEKDAGDDDKPARSLKLS